MNVTEYKVGAGTISGSGVFTCAVAGIYRFSGRTSLSNTSQRVFVFFFRNGTNSDRGVDSSATQQGQVVSTTMRLNVGDTVQLGVWTNTTANLDVAETENGSRSIFSGEMISRTV